MITNLKKLLKLIQYLKDTDRLLYRVIHRTVLEIQKKFKELQAGNYDIFEYVRQLTRGWVQRKGNSQVLKDTGAYLRSIKIREIDNQRFRVWTKQKALAKYLEFGTKNMPAIPHWRYIRRYIVMVFRKHMTNYLKGLRYLLS